MTLSDKTYFEQFELEIGQNIKDYIQRFDFINQNIDLGYQTQASAVYSSNIEGNSIDLNSFMNNFSIFFKKIYQIKSLKYKK